MSAAAVDSSLDTVEPSSATALCISKSVCSDENSVCSSNDQILAALHSNGPEANLGTDSHVTEHCGLADACVQSDKVTDVVSKNYGDEVDMDVQDQSSFETTIEYSVCSDTHDSKCEAQTTIDYYAKSTTESVINVDKNPGADIRTDAAVTSDIQKPVDILSVPNSVNVDLRNNPTVCSPPPTLMVV